MDLLELKKMSVPELREKAQSLGLSPAVRWSKPKLIKEIQSASSATVSKPGNEYDDFLNDNGQETPPAETTPPENVSESPTIEPGRGGDRPGAGRPVGTNEPAMRLKKALAVKVPDLNIRDGLHWLSMRGKSKKPAPDKTIDGAALYATKAAEYFGLLERIRNTPIFIFAALVIYTGKLINHLRGVNESEGKDSPDIRAAGNGQEQPGKESLSAV